MEHNEISEHEVRIYKVFRDSPEIWLTNREVGKQADVSGRTARAHTRRLVNIGILDQAQLFPGHRFRLAQKAAKRDTGYLNRLEKAAQIFGLK